MSSAEDLEKIKKKSIIINFENYFSKSLYFIKKVGFVIKMKLVEEFCLKVNCTEEEINILNLVNKKYEKKEYQDYLILTKNKLPESIKKIEGITKKDLTDLLYKYKIFLLDDIGDKIDIRNINDKKLLQIEKTNKLPEYSLIEEKNFLNSELSKKYKRSVFRLYSRMLTEVQKNQIYKRKLDLNPKQKLLVKFVSESYNFSPKNDALRPKSIIDPISKTIFEYNEILSNINKSVWINNEKNIFGNKVIIIAYRGTGLNKERGQFSVLGNKNRDLDLDRKIMFGKISQDKEVKRLIKDFDNIYKKYGEKYKYYLTGHSLGGRLAFEIHRKRPKKIKECHIFNAGFGIDIRYLNDIINSQKRDYKWEKNIYSYHIGGKHKKMFDDDFISVLSGGYGHSETFYGNFNTFLKGHSIDNFIEK